MRRRTAVRLFWSGVNLFEDPIVLLLPSIPPQMADLLASVSDYQIGLKARSAPVELRRSSQGDRLRQSEGWGSLQKKLH
jgi:hypothetical protein